MPIIQKEIQCLKYSLISKGFQMNFMNILKYPNYIFVPIFVSIIKKTSEIEKSMLAKGYISE